MKGVNSMVYWMIFNINNLKMKKLLLVFSLLLSLTTFAQREVARPKVVIGIVVDQMRWDYIYKFYNLYGENGFKRLLKNGYVCQNAMVNYLPSHTI